MSASDWKWVDEDGVMVLRGPCKPLYRADFVDALKAENTQLREALREARGAIDQYVGYYGIKHSFMRDMDSTMGNNLLRALAKLDAAEDGGGK